MTLFEPMLIALIYLLSMVITVPIARKIGLSPVLGYLGAGLILGPSSFGLLKNSQKEMLHFSEVGITMMLFLIGLELRPSLLWKLRGPIFGLGGLQVSLTTLIFFLLGIALGETWQSTLAIGMILSLSSTAIVLQTLQEVGALKTTGGETAFSVLLFQDLAVIPMLAVFPLLSMNGMSPSQDAHTIFQSELAWLSVFKVLSAVILVVLSGRYLMSPVFRIIGAQRQRELFTAQALLLVLSVTLLMNLVGLSPSLGAFLAGVVLADNEYRHQLETDIEPFKGLLLAFFFISVGSGIDFHLIQENSILILSIVLSILWVKWTILFLLGKLSKIPLPDQFLLAFSLAQGGEFAFVLLKVAQEKEVIPSAITQTLTVSVAISMFLAPLFIQSYFKWIQPRFSGCPSEREPDSIDETHNPVIIAGFGRFGQMVGRLLKGCGIRPTVLDYDADQIEVLRKFGIKAYYGDATQMDLLRAAGAEQAKLFIVAIDDAAKILEMVDAVKKEFPHLKILSRAYDRIHAYELIQRGIQYPFIETSGSALNLGIQALREMGFSEHKAERASQLFKKHNDESIQELARIYHEADEATFVTHSRNWISALEGMLQKDVLDESTESKPL